MLKYIFLSCLLMLSFGCDEGPEARMYNKEDAKWNAVMANHDVVMPMKETIHKVRKQLKKVAAENNNLTVVEGEKINQLLSNLDLADESMMNWMNGYQQLEKLKETMNHKEIMQYLEDQDILIKQIGKEMTNSIQAGLSFVKRVENQ